MTGGGPTSSLRPPTRRRAWAARSSRCWPSPHSGAVGWRRRSRFLERAYASYVEAGNGLRAGFMATRLAHEHITLLQPAVAQGWMGRATRHLDEVPEAAEHGYLALEQSLRAIASGDLDEAIAQARRAEELGRSTATATSRSAACSAAAPSMITRGDVAEGNLLIDEASAAAVAGELDPYSTVVVYCNTIGACRDLADFDRAGRVDRARARLLQHRTRCRRSRASAASTTRRSCGSRGGSARPTSRPERRARSSACGRRGSPAPRSTSSVRSGCASATSTPPRRRSAKPTTSGSRPSPASRSCASRAGTRRAPGRRSAGRSAIRR